MLRVVGGAHKREVIRVTTGVLYEEVSFYGCTFVADRKTENFGFANCAFHSCTYVYDGMEVDFAEWVTLTRRVSKPEPEAPPHE